MLHADGIFNAIFTKAQNLENLSIRGILLDGGVEDFTYLANAIHNSKLKSLKLYSPISDVKSFNLICESLEGSAIETLGLSETSSGDVYQEDIDNLIKAIPKMNFLKNLYLDGHRSINKPQLFTALTETNVENLSLELCSLNDDDAIILANLIPSLELKELHVSLNMIGQRGLWALEAAKELKPGLNLNIGAQLGNFRYLR